MSYYSRDYGAKGADRMATLVQSDQCSEGHLVCLHNVCTEITVQKLKDSANYSIYTMYMCTELIQQHTMVAGVKD